MNFFTTLTGLGCAWQTRMVRLCVTSDWTGALWCGDAAACVPAVAEVAVGKSWMTPFSVTGFTGGALVCDNNWWSYSVWKTTTTKHIFVLYCCVVLAAFVSMRLDFVSMRLFLIFDFYFSPPTHTLLCVSSFKLLEMSISRERWIKLLSIYQREVSEFICFRVEVHQS